MTILNGSALQIHAKLHLKMIPSELEEQEKIGSASFVNQFVICMQLFISVSIPQSCDKAKRNTSTHNAGRLEIHEVIHAVLSNHYRVGMQHDLVQTPILFASLTHRWKCVSNGKYIANPNWRFTYTSKQTEDHWDI